MRVEKDAIRDALDQMRARLPGAAPAIDRLDDLLHNALPVPLTDEVRVERQELAEIVQTMRAAFSQGTSAAPTN